MQNWLLIPSRLSISLSTPTRITLFSCLCKPGNLQLVSPLSVSMSRTASLYPAETNSGVVTSFIPLTTTWKPPSSCLTKFRLDGPSLMAFDPAYGLDNDVEPGAICGSPEMTTRWEQGLLGQGGSYKTRLSIGPMECPKGWSTLASSTRDSISVLQTCRPSYVCIESLQ